MTRQQESASAADVQGMRERDDSYDECVRSEPYRRQRQQLTCKLQGMRVRDESEGVGALVTRT